MPRSVVVLVLAAALAVLAAGCGGGDDNESAGTTETAATETMPTETGAGGAQEGGDPANGKQVFDSAGCGGCHTFSKAGSSGSVGPNLDDASPSFDKVVDQVTNGGGAMPAFEDRLSDQEIRDVAAFVSGQSS